MKAFDQAHYWRQRVSGEMGLGAVGHRSLGASYNRWIYQRRLDVLGKICNDTIQIHSDTRVLDLGCGSGFYEAYWHSCAIRHLTGIDISAQNISALQQVFPAYRFIEADITDGKTSLETKYDIVTLFDVLYHLVDDTAAVAALAFAADHVAQNGRILIFDQLVRSDYTLRQHVKFRGRDHFFEMLHSRGMEVEMEVPLFVFLEPPIYGNRILDILIAGGYYTAGLVFRAIPQIGTLAGRAAYAIDTALLKRRIHTNNHSVYVVRMSK